MPDSRARSSQSKRHVLDIDCACVGDCTIFRIQRWDDDPEFYGEMYVVPHPWDWRSRLRHAWSALTGRYANVPSPVLMEPEARRLGEWLLEQVDGAPCPCGEPNGGPPCTADRPCGYAQGMPQERWRS